MTREIHTLRDDAVTWYSDVLDEVTAVIPSSIARARELLDPIAGEVWMGSLTLHGATTVGADARTSRRVSEQTRAEVFLRDGFTCTYCGGRTIPRCVLVAISDVFPDAFPYYAHYRRGTVHPAYWALAPEADHVLAHANGGTSDAANLTTLHAMCNTRKSSLPAGSLPPIAEFALRDPGWDGLLSRYAYIVAVGETTGRRHSAARYHSGWLRRFARSAGHAAIPPEQPTRQLVVDTMASWSLEGMTPTPDALARIRSFADGDVSIEATIADATAAARKNPPSPELNDGADGDAGS